MDCDVVIIGAGVAGLAALRDLRGRGIGAVCLEARERIGGRVFTVHDPGCALPIELGAEFVHGRHPALWDLLQQARAGVYAAEPRRVRLNGGVVDYSNDTSGAVSSILDRMEQAAKNGPDVSFREFLDRVTAPEPAKEMATSYVQGFNAADASVIGIHSLAQDSAAADKIGGDTIYRVRDGYDAVPNFLAHGLSEFILTGCVADAVLWASEPASVHYHSVLTGERRRISSKRVIVTVPIGVLNAGDIHFSPAPTRALEAARALRFGEVVRVTLRFRENVLEQKPEIADAGFLFSSEPVFPTWWNALPFHAPMIVGWSSGPKADPLLGLDRAALVKRALHQLSRITGIPGHVLQAQLAAAHYHDWHLDPYARGAYSYTPAGALDARRVLSEPLDGRLFFAGEAAETEGHSATVHGALLTGLRAASHVAESVQ